MSIQLSSSAQDEKFAEVENKMFFNILARKPDSSVLDFVNKYFPIFTTPVVEGGWTSYPPIPDPPQQELTVHSLIFTKHPFLDFKFREGQLNMFGKQLKDVPMYFRDISLSFMFNSKKDADNAFASVTAMFKAVSKVEKFQAIEERTIANYSNGSGSSVHFILTRADVYEGRYTIIFRQGTFDDRQY